MATMNRLVQNFVLYETKFCTAFVLVHGEGGGEGERFAKLPSLSAGRSTT